MLLSLSAVKRNLFKTKIIVMDVNNVSAMCISRQTIGNASLIRATLDAILCRRSLVYGPSHIKCSIFFTVFGRNRETNGEKAFILYANHN